MQNLEKIKELESEAFDSLRQASEMSRTVVAAISSSHPELTNVRCIVNRKDHKIVIRAKYGDRSLLSHHTKATIALTLFENEIRAKVNENIMNAEW